MSKTVLYHRTTIARARAIMADGFEDDLWDFGLRDARSGDEVESRGVWLTGRPLSNIEGPEGNAVLEVTLGLSDEDLAPFELEEIFPDARLWVVPADLVNQHMSVRIHEVDQRSSGWFEATPDEGLRGGSR
jgi:hypothetical protein